MAKLGDMAVDNVKIRDSSKSHRAKPVDFSGHCLVCGGAYDGSFGCGGGGIKGVRLSVLKPPPSMRLQFIVFKF